MRHLMRAFVAVTILTASSCTRSGSDAEPEAGDDSASSSGEDAKPIALTDARLDKYIAFRKELNQSYARWHQGTVEVAKAVDSKSTDVGKGLAAVAGVTQLGQKYEKEITALRSKHGFTEQEDDRLWSAITEVTGAKVLDNPMMGDGFKMYRDMQAKGGEAKKAADEILKGFEDQEKEGLAAAREKYGDACVDLLSKRSRELSQLQADMMKELTGQMEGAAKQ